MESNAVDQEADVLKGMQHSIFWTIGYGAGSNHGDRQMAKNEKTSRRVASKAARLLRNPKTPKRVRSVAGSALTQAPTKGRRRRKRKKT